MSFSRAVHIIKTSSEIFFFTLFNQKPVVCISVLRQRFVESLAIVSGGLVPKNLINDYGKLFPER